MTANLPESCRQLIDLQRGVLARAIHIPGEQQPGHITTAQAHAASVSAPG
jgi:hypothetical protein